MDSELVKQLLEISEKSKSVEAENKQLAKENKKYKNELSDYKQETEKKYNENVNKLKGMVNKLKENCDNLNKETENYRGKFTNFKEEVEPRYKDEIKKLRQEKEVYHKDLIECQQVTIPNYKDDISNLKKDLTIAQNKLKAEVNKSQQSNAYSEKKIAELEAELRSKIKKIKELEKSNKELGIKSERLRKEASLYQSTSRDEKLTDYCEDKNNPAQLTNDLNFLQEKIEKYVTTLKGSVVINDEEFLKLFERYNLKIKKQTTTDKLLMKSVLQRYVLETVLECADEYLNKLNDNHPLSQEKQIVDNADNLSNLLDKFHNDHLIKHDDNNDNNKDKFVMTSNIREQVYGLLGKHAFSEIRDENGDGDDGNNDRVDDKQLRSSKHPFVSTTVQKLNALMAEYRLIKDENKRKYTENMAENIVKDIVRIFRFRLLIHEKNVGLYWFKRNDKIRPDCMKGPWDDDCFEDYVVDVCFFPLIGTNLKDDVNGEGLDLSKSKIISYAKVCPRSVINSQEEEKEASPEEEKKEEKKEVEKEGEKEKKEQQKKEEKKEEKETPLENDSSSSDVIFNILRKVIGGHRSANQQNNNQSENQKNHDDSSSTSSTIPQNKITKTSNEQTKNDNDNNRDEVIITSNKQTRNDDNNDDQNKNSVPQDEMTKTPNEQTKNDDNVSNHDENSNDDPSLSKDQQVQQILQNSSDKYDNKGEMPLIDSNDTTNDGVNSSGNNDGQEDYIQEDNNNVKGIFFRLEESNYGDLDNLDDVSDNHDDGSDNADDSSDDLEDSLYSLDNDYDEVGSNESF